MISNMTPSISPETVQIRQAEQSEKSNLLIVDDTPANLRLLSSMLTEEGYKVRSVLNGQMALTAAKTAPPDLILLDINMPDMNGYQVCQQLKADKSISDIPVIFISALDELQDKVKAFAAGGMDYITKPFQLEEVLARVRTHLTLRNTQRQLEAARSELLETNHHLEQRVQQQVLQLYSSQLATIFALAKLADSRDSDTGKHLDRTGQYCRLMAEQLVCLPQYQGEIDDLFIEDLTIASALHDIGKVGIPDQILLKPGKLTAEEFEVMKTHTIIGAQALREVDQKYPGNKQLRMGIEIAESHHEKWDGLGYPHKLAGMSIPLAARILALVDVYDALTSLRPYKSPFSHAKSSEIITADRSRHFDPDMVDCFLQVECQFAVIRENCR
jgi:putative two-component system response regulator